METKIFAGLIFVMNLAGFFAMGLDKRRARHNQYRIREKTLWYIAFFGGAVGATTGMKYFRHKTKHSQFAYGMPILAVIEIGIFAYLFKLFG